VSEITTGGGTLYGNFYHSVMLSGFKKIFSDIEIGPPNSETQYI